MHDYAFLRPLYIDFPLCCRVISVITALFVLSGCHDSADEVQHGADTNRAKPKLDLDIAVNSQAAIGLKTVTVKPMSVPQTIPATGWLIARPPGEIIVKAPSTGFVTVSADSHLSVGSAVNKDERVGTVQVFLAPHEQAQLVAEKADADTLIEQSQATAQAAEEQLKRIEKSAPDAVAGTRLTELKETIARARSAERHAREKLPFMASSYRDGVQLSEVPVESPIAGRIVNIHFAPKQFVAQGDALVTIADWSRLWIQVPVFAADIEHIARDKPATITLPGGKQTFSAKPVNAPQPSEPGKQTIALLYECENVGDALRPGESVSVSLTMDKQSSSLVVPNASVLWDGMGNSWIYLKTSETAFRRRKVELGQPNGENAVVRRGLQAGDVVVTTGAEALYGEEFKDQIRAGDND